MAHTPGPWKLHGSELKRTSVGEPYAIVLTKYAAIDVIAPVGMADEHVANARLMAASPEMFAALKAVQKHCPADHDINPQWNAAWAALLAAIAKAEA